MSTFTYEVAYRVTCSECGAQISARVENDWEGGGGWKVVEGYAKVSPSSVAESPCLPPDWHVLDGRPICPLHAIKVFPAGSAGDHEQLRNIFIERMNKAQTLA